jgi:DNA invertase Pin-like site-specific DNA recombinase
MALIGYARVSTAEQDTALQTDALRKAGCERIFEDTVSGVKADRHGLAAALAYLRDGDVLAVWRLDRLGRSLPHLIETISAWRRVPFTDRKHRHHHIGRAAHLPRIRCAGSVRA